ncbi:MAG: UDP-N-acetylmuramoyl-tripeptide--D-alanyl-D-alanine ligase [Myxococcota bacterium]
MVTPIPDNQASFTLEDVARATGGRLRAGRADGVRGVVTDSRAVREGCLFVALRGEHHDAHRFVPDAVRQGAAAVLVARGTTVPEGPAVVEVEDTLWALGDLAALHRRRWKGRVVGITGSAGKTSTKELTAAALRACGFAVHPTQGNLNNLVGLPMTVLQLDEGVDAAVLEMGTNRPGEIARLADVGRPDVGVITLVSAAHTEGLGNVEKVAEEKAALLMALEPRGTAVVQGDDATLVSWAERSPAEHVLFFGQGAGAQVRLVRWELEPELRTRCTFALAGRDEPLVARLRLLGEAAAINAAAALAAVVAIGADPVRAATALEEVAPSPGRMHPLAGERDTLVLDDSYNANPRSTALALDTAAELGRLRDGRVVAVLGDMKELGDRSIDEHRAVGEHAARVGVAVLVAIGDAMAHAAQAAAARGIRTVRVARAEDAIEPVRDVLLEGDVVLVKGSRSLATERVAHALHAGEGTS